MTKAVLWGGRFASGPDEAFKAFNDSLRFDYRLAEQDIIGSKAWAVSLKQIDVLTEQECQDLCAELDKLLASVQANPKQILASDAEDIHSWVESHLVDTLGGLGKKLHTGRSRNDQVATDLKLWVKKRIDEIKIALLELQSVLIKLAEVHPTAVIPGYTHLQRAQPVLFAHWCLAYVEMFNRDWQRMNDATKHMDTCPLGSGALAGTGFAIDRDDLAKRLGFKAPNKNSMDAASDRDFVMELLSVASIGMVHLSRMAEDLIFYNSGEAGFVEFDDSVTSGSSIMPQKKNPDLMELVRGKTGRVCGALNGMLMTMKGLPMAYNKDLQEDKEGVFDATETWIQCLSVTALALSRMKVREERSLIAAQQGYSNATELADYLVTKQIPFREAHEIVGNLVQVAISREEPLEHLPLELMQQYCEHIQNDVFIKLTISACIDKRNAIGGTSHHQVHQALRRAKLAVQSEQAELSNVRQAKLSDVDAIMKLVNYWSEQGENLPRSREDVLQAIRTFAVVEVDGEVVGCGALYIYGTGLAEIRSLGLSREVQGQGLGKALVHYLLKEAEYAELKRVIVLTRVPEFFKLLDFRETDKSFLPEKVIKDCDICPRKDNCDETALEFFIA